MFNFWIQEGFVGQPFSEFAGNFSGNAAFTEDKLDEPLWVFSSVEMDGNTAWYLVEISLDENLTVQSMQGVWENTEV